MNNEQPTSQSGFFQWISNLGIVRRQDDRWFAGVASGIAQKANIDSLIVRGIFVVLAVLGGPGLLLYLAAWLLLPDAQGRIHLQQLLRGKATPGVVVAAIIIAITIFAGIFGGSIWSVFNSWQWSAWAMLGMPGWVSGMFTWIFWIGVLTAIAIVLHQLLLKKGKAEGASASPEAGQVSSADANPASAGASPATTAFPTTAFTTNTEGVTESQPTTDIGSTSDASTGASSESANFNDRINNFADQATTVLTDSAEKVSDWGVNVAEKVDQQATDWSKKYAETYEHSKPGAGHVLITLAIALIGGAATTLWVYVSDSIFENQLATTPLKYFLPGLIVTTAIFAISMIIAGIRGKRSGLIGLFSALGVVSLVFTSVLPTGSSFYVAGDTHSTAETPAITMLAGNLDIDLRGLDNLQSRDEYTVNMGLGDVELMLPEERPTTITVMIGAGRIIDAEDRPRLRRSGVFTNQKIVINEDSKLKPLEVTVRLLAGNVNISGGNSVVNELIRWQLNAPASSETSATNKEHAL